jgi:pimeloyl-ACP methyl ester carboxylesterase
MRNFKKPFIILFIGISVVFNGCKTSTEPSVEANKYLVSSSVIGEFTKEQLTQRLTSLNLGASGVNIGSFLRYGIKVHKLVYKTKNTDGKEIEASGALIFPTGVTNAVPLISIQHGTITDESQAPSYFGNLSESGTVGALFGSLGYIIAYPDYIGYGASKSVPHPYEHRESLATSCLDMLRAAREFIKQEKVQWDDRLYISGYSEGGFATMSLQKKLEEEFPTEFNLRASSCGAGAYDKTSFMKFVINNKTSGNPDFNTSYLWVLLTYDRVYGLNRALTTYFKEPFATQIAANRERTQISVSLNQIFTDAFAKGINDGTDTGFINAVKDNDVYDWKPKTPTRLYHGEADTYVYYFNSDNAVKAMQARGATNVKLEPIKGQDHGGAISDFLLGTFSFFSTTQ